MKAILIFFILFTISCNRSATEAKRDHKDILLYFINDQTLTLRPGQITEAQFWASSENLDTLRIKDTTGKCIARFNTLQDTILYSSDEVDLFPHVFAFVFERDDRLDTFYADRELKLFEWKGKGKRKFYKDTTSFFKEKFYTISNLN